MQHRGHDPNDSRVEAAGVHSAIRWHDKNNLLLNIKHPIVKHFTGDYSRELEHEMFTNALKVSQQNR